MGRWGTRHRRRHQRFGAERRNQRKCRGDCDRHGKLIDEYLRNDFKLVLVQLPGRLSKKEEVKALNNAYQKLANRKGIQFHQTKRFTIGDALGRRTTPSPREDTRTRQGYVQRLEGHQLMCPFEGRLAVLPDRLVQRSAPRPHTRLNWSDDEAYPVPGVLKYSTDTEETYRCPNSWLRLKNIIIS